MALQTLEQLKGLSPNYAEIPNGEFAYRVWFSEKQKAPSVREAVPMGVWADAHGLSSEDFKAMLKASEEKGYTPTERTISNEYIPEDSEGRAFLQGQTFGWGDEVVGGLAAFFDKMRGNEASMNDLYVQYRDKERQKLKEYSKARPGEALGYELAGSIASPLMLGRGSKAFNPTSAAAINAGKAGAVYGLGASEEETTGGLVYDTGTAAMSSALFGAGLQKVFSFTGKKANVLSNRIKKVEETPTVEGLRQVKNNLYSEVDKSGVRFDNKDFSVLMSKVNKILSEGHHQPKAETQVAAALNILKGIKASGEKQTLSQVNKLQQKFNKYYSKNRDQPLLLSINDALDNMIQQKAGNFSVLQAAKNANSKYKKAELFDREFYKVGLDEHLKDKGSDILYKQAVANVLKSENKMKYFSPEEAKVMEEFIKGKYLSNVLAKTGDLAPGTNRLMGALGLYGYYISPLIIVPTALSSASQKISSKNVKSKAENLVNLFGGVKQRAPGTLPPQAAKAVGVYSTATEQ